jgi:hypothetical protein
MEELVSDFIEPFCYQAEEANKVLDYHIQPGLKATIDRQLVTELLAILFENALEIHRGGRPHPVADVEH